MPRKKRLKIEVKMAGYIQTNSGHKMVKLGIRIPSKQVIKKVKQLVYVM